MQSSPLVPRPKITFPGIIKGQPIKRLFHDFETFSEADLPNCGADAYSRDPSTEVLLTSFAINEEPVKLWSPVEGERMPAQLEDAVLDERVIKSCWNKSFEHSIWKNVLGINIPHNQWQDSMALSLTLSLPGKLEKAGPVVGLPEDEQKLEGTALINFFTKPRKPTKTKTHTRNFPNHDFKKWDEFCRYNIRDTEAERAIFRKLRKYMMSDDEWEMWVIDQIINERGIPMNMNAVDAACRLYDTLVEQRLKEMNELTGLGNANSPKQLLPWLQERGYRFDDLKKGHVSRSIEQLEKDIERDDDLPQEQIDLHRVLVIRSEVSRTSTQKYFAIQRAVDRLENVLRYTLQFAGAGRTWRWAGRIFQPQNLPRPDKVFEKVMLMAVDHLEHLEPEVIDLIYHNPFDLLASCLRSVVQAMTGHLIVDADLNAIENRVLGWMTYEEKILNVFAKDRCPYLDFATYMHPRSYDELWHEYKVLKLGKIRQDSKPAVLGCGYQLGAGYEYENEKTGEMEATGLLGYAWNMGVKLTAEQAKEAVDVWRATFKKAVNFWYEVEDQAIACVRTGKRTDAGYIRFEMNDAFLQMVLPSGRRLSYCRPRLKPTITPWGTEKEQISYEQVNENKQWGRTSTYGGKLTENADQAIARDLLATGIKRAHYRGLDIFLHVHDQVVIHSPEDRAEKDKEILIECLTEPTKWGAGLPLKAEGVISPVFMKD